MSENINVENPLEKEAKSLILITSLVLISFIVWFILISLKQYGGFGYFGYNLLLQSVIVQCISASIIFPLIHIGVASIWQSKRTSRSRRNIFFGWSLFGILSALIQLYAFYKVN